MLIVKKELPLVEDNQEAATSPRLWWRRRKAYTSANHAQVSD